MENNCRERFSCVTSTGFLATRKVGVLSGLFKRDSVFDSSKWFGTKDWKLLKVFTKKFRRVSNLVLPQVTAALIFGSETRQISVFRLFLALTREYLIRLREKIWIDLATAFIDVFCLAAECWSFKDTVGYLLLPFVILKWLVCLQAVIRLHQVEECKPSDASLDTSPRNF